MYEARAYRDWVSASGLVSFQVAIRESDLLIRARRDLRHQAEDLLRDVRADIEEEIRRGPEFLESLSPLPLRPGVPPVIDLMLRAAKAYDVGPMAAVAGAVAQLVGEGLLRWTPEVIIENGGDIWMKMDRPVEMGLYSGENSPFTGALRLRVDPAGKPLGVCTSSGTVGHSLSFGKADAVVIVADDAALADAAATAVCNRIQGPNDIEKLLAQEQQRGTLKGLLITLAGRMGAYGEIEILQ